MKRNFPVLAILVWAASAYLFVSVSVSFADMEIVRDGEARSEIIVSSDATPQAELAATELRDHVLEISGAELAIVTEPGGDLYPIYVGPSAHTRRLGLGLDDIEHEGYKIIATTDYLALLGHDEIFPFCPPGHTDWRRRDHLLEEWQEFAGKKYDFPFNQIYDPRYFNQDFGFSLHDPSGTLFAVYDLLEQLGVRWYMPHHDFGTVLPESADLSVKEQEVTKEPAFDRRFLRVGWGTDRDTFLWYKRQRLGVFEIAWNCHGTSRVTRFLQDEHPEFLAKVGGRTLRRGDNALPRLAPPLRDELIRYARHFFEFCPGQRHVSVGPADAFTTIDDRDIEAGWQREERGPRGRHSDYVWNFIDDVAAGIAEEYPDRIVMGLAYSGYREPPEDLDRFLDNVGVTYCQSRSNFYDPDLKQRMTIERQEWRGMMQKDEFYIWEYYLWHRPGRPLWGVPVIFWGAMQEDMQALEGVSRGEYVEAWPLQSKEMWGINHMTIYLQSRLYWEPDLDREALLDEYYDKFYGPAAAEMRAFFEFAESVWMRPKSRTIPGEDGFLQPEDADHYFDILEQAAGKVNPDSYYGRRIGLIAEECRPMKDMFAFSQYEARGRTAADEGDVEKAVEYLGKAVAAATCNRRRANTAHRLGHLYRDQVEDVQKALETYRLVMDTHITGAGSAVRRHARMDAVGLLRREQRYEEALELLDGMPSPKRHDFWWVRNLRARAAIAGDRGDTKAAANYYRQALEVRGISDSAAEAIREQLEKIME